MRLSKLSLQALMLAMLMPLAAHSQISRSDFIPEKVFAGRSQGKGELKILLGKTRPFTVQSLGTMQSDGSFRLDQEVRFEGEPVESRSWVMQQYQVGSYSAKLTGAAGPVTGHTEGSRMTLLYPLNNWGLSMEQTMDLAEDGHTILNYGSIRFLGIPVGELRETIQLRR